MDKALRVYSWKGVLVEPITALDIRSREDALKLGPFASEGRLVYWRGWGQIKETGKWRKPHFSHYPLGGGRQININPDREFSDLEQQKSESRKHKRAKEVIATVLRKLIADRKSLSWHFKDERASDFPFSGDLLADVVQVATEHEIKTPFGRKYRLDVALLGDPIVKEPVVLGAIEIEFTSRLDMTKCLLCKCLGFPLMTVDVSELDEENIDERWAFQAVTETTVSSGDGRRRNFIYLHDSLYPVYINPPENVLRHNKHQYILFAKDQQVHNLEKYLLKLAGALHLPMGQINIQKIVVSNEQMKTMAANEGSMAGQTWRNFSETTYLRVSLPRPSTAGGPVYRFHLVMNMLCNSYFDCLTGYKHEPGRQNYRPEEEFWYVWVREGAKSLPKRYLRKSLSEPASLILRALHGVTK